MIKAIDINWHAVKKGGFIKVKIEKLIYQKWFLNKPGKLEINSAVMTFKDNYAGLKEQARQPAVVKKHHLDD